jgi:AcrR family transcriptional regulator
MATNTASEILDATQKLLLERGESKTTLRAITELADANVAAVNYHFGSRDELIRHAYLSALAEVTTSQGARIQSLDEKADLEELVNIWLGPLLEPKSVSQRERDLWNLLQRGSVENVPQLQALMPSMQEMELSPLIALLGKKLPHLDRTEIVFRHNAILLGLGGLLRSSIGTSIGKQSAASTKSFVSKWVLASLRG